ncbi:hypothetical protein KR084_000984 [Drosophila pseudotakahashii]|nr:hypothetical protein KR084_000984 [Drosophila pseudotakahashii]
MTMAHCLWSTPLGLLCLLALLSMATARSVRQLPGAYPHPPALPTGFYGQPPYAYPAYGYGYQAPPPPPVYSPYYDNVFGVYKSYPGGGYPVRFDYNNRCSRNYIGIKPHPDQQQYYYVCKPNCVIFSKCRDLESFNSSSGRCVQHIPQHRQLDPRPPQCQKEGRFPHPHDCKVYYRCDKNRTQPWLFACPAGTIFSPVERKCLPGDQCPSTEISDSGSYIPQNCELKFPECSEEGTFRSPTDCALYYTCRLQESGTYLQTRFKCPGSNSFDLERKLCRPRNEVDCFDYVPEPQVPVPYAPQPYYAPYQAPPPLYEEDDYDTGAKEQEHQPALKSERVAGAFERPSLNVVILPTTKSAPTTTSTSERTTAHHKYDPYPSYDHYSHHSVKEAPAMSLKVEKEDVLPRFKLSENIVILPTTPAPTTAKETTKYQYKRYTYASAKEDEKTEAPEIKKAFNGLHLSENIVILPTTTTTTTAKPTVPTCPTLPTTSSTAKPNTTTTVTVTTTTPKATTVITSTQKPTTTTQKTSTITEKTTTPTPKTTVVTSTTQKRSTTTHKTSPVFTTTKKATTITPKTTISTEKPTKTTLKTTSVKTTTQKPTTTTPKSTTTTSKPTTVTTTTKKPVTTTTKKTTESSPKPTTSSEKPTTTTQKISTTSTTTQKPTITTPKTTTTTKVTTTSQKPTSTSQKTSTATTTTKKTTESSPQPTTSSEKPTSTTPKVTTQKPSTTTLITVTTTTEKTTTSTHKPTTSTEKPTTTTQKTTSTQKPTTFTPKPTTTTPKPTTTTQKTTSSVPSTTKVSTTTQKPTVTTTTVKTTESSPKPTTSTEKPTTTTPKISTISTTSLKPTSTTPKSTTTTQETTTSVSSTTKVTTTTQKPTTTSHKTSTVTTTSIKTTTNTPKPTTSTEKPTTTTQKTTSTQKPTTTTTEPTTTTSTTKLTTTTNKPTTTSPITSTVTTSTQKPTTKPATTTEKTTTTTPKPTTVTTTTEAPKPTSQKTTSTQKPTTTTPTPTTTTPKPTPTTPKHTTTNQQTTTTQKPTVTTPKTSTVTTITVKTTESSPKPTSTTTTTQKPTTPTTPKTTTVTTTTQKSTTTTPKTSTVTTSPKPNSSTQKPTTTTREPTSVTATSTVTTTTIPAQNSTIATELTTATRPHCPDSDSTSDNNTNPACTQELQQVKQLQLHSPQKQQANTSLTESRNTLGGGDEPDYMDDAPASSAEGESGQATTARAPTMSTLAAAHLLRKLFHIISTTPPSREHPATTSQRPPSQHSSPGVTLAQMARHNLATSKPFIAHSLRLSIQQLASNQKRSIQPKTLVVPPVKITKKEAEDSEYYDSETSEQYADEENEVLTKLQPKAMSSTTVAAVIPAPSSTTERETSSVPSTTTTAQPTGPTTTTGDLEYGDSSGDSDYPNDGNDVNEIPNGVVTSLEARKSFLLSLLKGRLTRMEVKKPESTTTSAAPRTSGTSTTKSVTTSTTKSTTTSTTARTSTSTIPSSTTRPETTTLAPTRARNSSHLSSEYYDDDEDYMEDEPAGSPDAEKKDRSKGLVATAKRHVVLTPAKIAAWHAKGEIASKATSDGLLFKGLAIGETRGKLPTKMTVNRAPGNKVLNMPHTLMQTTIPNRTPRTETSTPKQASTSTETSTTPLRGPETFTTLKPLEIVTPTTSETLPTASAMVSAAIVPSAPSATSVVRQEVLSVNKRPWLLAARNQTVHLTPISSKPSNPVSQANQVNPSSNQLVSSPEDYSTEKVPQLIVKVYEPIDLKIVFCPKSCDQDHDHKFDPADNYKKSNCSGGCDDEEERIHKHVDIQWKPLELDDIAGFRNAV